MGRTAAVAVVIAAAVTAGCSESAGCQIDPCPPGTSTVTAVDSLGREAWATQLPDRVDTVPMVSGDSVIVQGCHGAHVLSAEDGRVLATAADLQSTVGLGADRVFGTSRTSDTAVLVGYPVGAATAPLSVPRSGAAAVADGRLLVVDEASSSLRVISADSRALRVPLPSARHATVSAAGELGIVASGDGAVTAVDLASGRLSWRVSATQVAASFGFRVIASPSVVVATLWPSGEDQPGSPEVMAIEPHTGRVLWRAPARSALAASAHETVLIADGSLEVRDTRTGDHLWSRSASVEPMRASGSSAPGDPAVAVLARGTVAVSGATIGERAATVAFDSVTGRTLWSSTSATLRSLDQSAQAATATFDMLPVNAGGPALADAHDGRILWRAPGHAEEASGNRALVTAAPAQDATISVDGQVPRPGRCS